VEIIWEGILGCVNVPELPPAPRGLEIEASVRDVVERQQDRNFRKRPQMLMALIWFRNKYKNRTQN